VTVRVSDRLPVDPRTMDADKLAEIIRDALLALGGQAYVDSYAQDVKARRHPTGTE
jgi:hypothetical protein